MSITNVDAGSIPRYTGDMDKTQPMGIRLSDAERAALKVAAAQDDRHAAAMGRTLIVRGLRDMGLLPEPHQPPRGLHKHRRGKAT